MTYSGNNQVSQVNSEVPEAMTAGEVASNLFPQPPPDFKPDEDANDFYEDRIEGKVWVWDGEKWSLQYNYGHLYPPEVGAQGKPGPQGPTGPKWEYDELTAEQKKEVKGPTGATGSGATGATGIPGSIGEPGATGPRGDAICSNVKTVPGQDTRGKLFIDKNNQIYVTLG